MDPFVWTTIAEFWWIGPVVIGTGALGWIGLRHQRTERARRLAYEAAKLELRAARQRSATARGAAKLARAELARVQAERTAAHATSADVAAARRELQSAQREARAATATVRAGRARVTAARAALPSAATPAEELPLARITAAHDAVTARWISYETDAAKVLAFPAMSDGRQPLTAAYLTVQAEAQQLRPRTARVTAAEFAAYREAVERLGRAFDAAEADAWRQARAAGTAPAGSRPASAEPEPSAAAPWATDWSAVAQSVAARSAEALTRAAEAATAAFETRAAPRRDPRGSRGSDASGETDADATASRPSTTPPVWPVPSRDRRPER